MTDNDREERLEVDEIAYGDWKALADRYADRALHGAIPGSARDRHYAEAGHWLRYGCCAEQRQIDRLLPPASGTGQ